jgi:hypothetical protein
MIMKTITISPVLNGFLIKAGCQTVVFTTVEDVCNQLRRYLTDPLLTEKDYLNNALNAKFLKCQAVDPGYPAEAGVRAEAPMHAQGGESPGLADTIRNR